MSDFVMIGDGTVAGHDQTFALINRGYDPENRKAGQWFETTPEMFDYFLNILPPRHFLGFAFVMSEAATESLSDAWIMHGKRAFCLAVRNGSQMDFQETVRGFLQHVSERAAA
ncbi:DUF1419 domain-containing protein [Jannaschia marina]|uniref:DUF1419 domain-containing protein n=1 Tax=Jannaschia marina TaxID=2741674 RepID=UPI0015C8E20D|nr:DUF1419 domain-containing protein [Jannaschia marina]